MPVGTVIGIAVAALLVGGGVGAGVATKLARDGQAGQAAAAQAAADAAAATGESNVGVSEATGDAVEGGIDAAKADDNTDADTRQGVAAWDATTTAIHAAVQPGATRTTIALAGYLGCVGGAQGKGEGSAAFGCTKRGEALDAALAAMPAPEPVSAPTPDEP